LPTAQKPKFGKPGDAGADLVATSVDFSRDSNSQIVYGTGIAVEIPEGMVGLVFPRSSVRNYDLVMSNSVGVIDSGYRGEIIVTFNLKNPWADIYKVGDRIAQLVIMPVPLAQFVEVEELSETSRGTEGHGSTGK
jgi:deoxyuridine 5''-triphosphate nucleotidohydrolase (dut)